MKTSAFASFLFSDALFGHEWAAVEFCIHTRISIGTVLVYVAGLGAIGGAVVIVGTFEMYSAPFVDAAGGIHAGSAEHPVRLQAKAWKPLVHLGIAGPSRNPGTVFFALHRALQAGKSWYAGGIEAIGVGLARSSRFGALDDLLLFFIR